MIETCFIDNTYYEKMCESKVYYILPKAYFHSLKKATMVQRVLSAFPLESLRDTLNIEMKENNRTSVGSEVAITKKIMYLVREFLSYPRVPPTNKTARHKQYTNRKSRRKI
jgi:hypothetical protein